MTLAIDGGTPVRTTMLPYGRGASSIGEEEIAAVEKVLRSKSLFRYYGPDLQGTVGGFEDGIRSYLGVTHATAVSSGTAALRCALAALGVGCGDEVVVPAFTFIATVNAVVLAGAVPVFAEVDDTLTMDPASVEAVCSSRTAAIMPVHLENVVADMDALVPVARSRGLGTIEDAAQALGATYHGRAAGSLGDLGCFSLQLEKNITAGEGGIVVSDDDRLALRVARYQDQGGQFVTQKGEGRGGDLDTPFVGENLRMTEVGGAIAGVQLGRLPGLVTSMRRVRQAVLDGVGELPGLVRRREPDPSGCGGSSLTWFAPDAAAAKRFGRALVGEGVPASRMYNGLPVYATPAILERRTATNKGGPWHCAEHPTDVTYAAGLCPITEDLASRQVTMGIAPTWNDADIADAVEALTKVATALVA